MAAHADRFWCPVRSDFRTVQAPDESYNRWEEGNVASGMTFEVESGSNMRVNLDDGVQCYDDYRVAGYHRNGPFQGRIHGWHQRGEHRIPISSIHGWKSPRLGLTVTKTAEDGVVLYCPAGQRFRSMVEIIRKSVEDEVRTHEAERRAIGARIRAELAHTHAVHEQVRAAPEQPAAQETRARAAAKQQAAGAKAEIECPLARLRAGGLSGHGSQVVR